MEPTTGYAQLGDDRIAYQVLGDGPVDIVLTIGSWSAFGRISRFGSGYTPAR